MRVSISDEKPVPSPQRKVTMHPTPEDMFQSQMRSQFPRHVVYRHFGRNIRDVSISDEKPVPSPQNKRLYYEAHKEEFQSQMRSQFPRHTHEQRLPAVLRNVSISDEKPVPSPHMQGLRGNRACRGFNL